MAAFIWVLPAHAGTESPAKAVAHLLSAASPPKGVVFDIVSRDPKYLDTALEQVKVWERQLQARYPTIDIAVVSHGDEQLALTTDKQAIEFTANSLVEELLGDNVALHVCAAHAATKGVAPDEYPAHIDVTPSGPAKIADYVDRGYVLIVL
ncbi:MAG: DsrE family protein [Pseudomonadota bacterium]